MSRHGMKFWGLVPAGGLFMALAACGGGSTIPPVPPPSNCGPPTYSCTAASNATIPGGPLAVVNYPATIPDIGNLTGAGTVITDPAFGNPIARCTDANTDPIHPNIAFDTNGGGAAMVNHFNKNDTIVYVQEHGGTGFPLLFDASTMQCSRMYPDNPSYASAGGLTITGIGADFSYSNPNWLYVWYSVVGAPVDQILRYDFSNYSSSGSPTVTLIADFIADSGPGFTGTPGNCLPAKFISNWVGHDGPNSDDTVFTAAYSEGFQDSGFRVVAWKVGSGCRVYNTSTGIVSGDWGPTGPVSVFYGNSTTPESTDEFYIHDIFANFTGEYALIGNGSCVTENQSCLRTAGAPYFWQIATTSVRKSQNMAGGELAFGWNDLINRNNSPLGQYAVRPFTAQGSPMAVITTLPAGMVVGLGSGPSWLNDNTTDSLPFFDSLNFPLYYQTGFPSAWTNEIIGVFPNGNTLRFAHNFTTKSNPQFSTNRAVGSVSQSGKFFMQSSDWVGTLGSTSGGATCRWGYDWLAGQTYPSNFENLAPQSGNDGEFVYQATSCSGSCTSGSTEPVSWNQTPGGTTPDGTITWTNLGAENCRGDVFVVKLQ
jgi:hypothetical protein